MGKPQAISYAPLMYDISSDIMWYTPLPPAPALPPALPPAPELTLASVLVLALASVLVLALASVLVLALASVLVLALGCLYHHRNCCIISTHLHPHPSEKLW